MARRLQQLTSRQHAPSVGECMNQLLFERESGALGQGAFARAVASRALHSLQLWPHLRFDGGEASAPVADEGRVGGKEEICACQAGVNSLAVDKFDHKLWVDAMAEEAMR